jgi:hypothetical protein
VTHHGWDSAALERLCSAAGVALRFVAVAPETTYYAAKNAGFGATTADVVAFADADCWPDPGWLERLLSPFADPAVQVTAGRTVYRAGVFGTALTTIDFLYFPSPSGVDHTRNFYANNVAFRRDVFEAHRYRVGEDFYRGHCQTVGLRLRAAGVPIRFVSTARTVHRLPDSVGELVRLRLLRGADTVSLAPHIVDALIPGAPPLVRHPALAASAVLAARWACSLVAINRQDQPQLRGTRRLACAAALTAVSLVDGAGAVGRVAGRDRRAVTLSYHRGT